MNNLDRLGEPKKNVYSVKPWASRLYGKVPAMQLRGILARRLDPEHTLHINMAGVKAITPGFARECFGILYIIAVKNGCMIEFTHTPSHLRMLILNGVKEACRPQYEKESLPSRVTHPT